MLTNKLLEFESDAPRCDDGCMRITRLSTSATGWGIPMREDTVNRNQVNIVRAGAAPEPPLIAEKLARLEQIADDVKASFPYIQDVHGQRRFPSFPIDAVVRYLHALWICDCKDRLLGVPTTLGRRKRGSDERFERHEGQHALKILCEWQEGKSAPVVAFLELKLDYAPFSQLTHQLEEASRAGNRALSQRLAHGRKVLLNRTHNLMRALSAIFALPPDRLVNEVRAASAAYNHTPEQCAAQLAELKTPLYQIVRHPALARRNMLLMNALGITVTENEADLPGRRTPTVQRPTMPQPGYAEHIISGATTMVDIGPLQL